MKSYNHIKKFIDGAKSNMKYFEQTRVGLTFDTFLDNWSANYHAHDLTNLQILMDFEEDVDVGLYTKQTINERWVSYTFTEAGKDYLRFKEML